MRRSSIRIAVLIGLFAAAPAASASPVDVATDHTALVAYHRYLQDAVSGLPTLRKRDDAYIASISTQCPNVLASLKDSGAGTVNQNALTAFGEELAGDLVAEGFRAYQGAEATLATTLTPLPWSTPRPGEVVKRFLFAERRLVHVAPSDLCADAQALAASHARTTPPGTSRWLNSFLGDLNVEQQRASALRTTLTEFQTPADNTLVAAINRLTNHFAAKGQAAFTSEAKTLIAALGLPT